MSIRSQIIAVIFLACLITAGSCLAQDATPATSNPLAFLYKDFCEGHWRTEFSGAAMLDTGPWEGRSKDYFFTGYLEYGWPINPRIVSGIRTYPALLYFQHKDDDDQSGIIFGQSIGPAFRLYAQKDTYQGLFLESGASLLWNSRRFRDNGAHINFLLELGLGYQFTSNWHTAVKYYHISNANTENPNVGVNSLAVCMGYTF